MDELGFRKAVPAARRDRLGAGPKVASLEDPLAEISRGIRWAVRTSAVRAAFHAAIRGDAAAEGRDLEAHRRRRSPFLADPRAREAAASADRRNFPRWRIFPAPWAAEESLPAATAPQSVSPPPEARWTDSKSRRGDASRHYRRRRRRECPRGHRRPTRAAVQPQPPRRRRRRKAESKRDDR